MRTVRPFFPFIWSVLAFMAKEAAFVGHHHERLHRNGPIYSDKRETGCMQERRPWNGEYFRLKRRQKGKEKHFLLTKTFELNISQRASVILHTD